MEPGYQGEKTAMPDTYSAILENSRKNRRQPTDAESAIWQALRANQTGVRFRRQHIIADYIADFVSLKHHLVIEIDGGYHFIGDQPDEDFIRTKIIEHYGFRILRFTNEEVLANRDEVIKKIIQTINNQY